MSALAARVTTEALQRLALGEVAAGKIPHAAPHGHIWTLDVVIDAGTVEVDAPADEGAPRTTRLNTTAYVTARCPSFADLDEALRGPARQHVGEAQGCPILVLCTGAQGEAHAFLDVSLAPHAAGGDHG